MFVIAFFFFFSSDGGRVSGPASAVCVPCGTRLPVLVVVHAVRLVVPEGAEGEVLVAL